MSACIELEFNDCTTTRLLHLWPFQDVFPKQASSLVLYSLEIDTSEFFIKPGCPPSKLPTWSPFLNIYIYILSKESSSISHSFLPLVDSLGINLLQSRLRIPPLKMHETWERPSCLCLFASMDPYHDSFKCLRPNHTADGIKKPQPCANCQELPRWAREKCLDLFLPSQPELTSEESDLETAFEMDAAENFPLPLAALAGDFIASFDGALATCGRGYFLRGVLFGISLKHGSKLHLSPLSMSDDHCCG